MGQRRVVQPRYRQNHASAGRTRRRGSTRPPPAVLRLIRRTSKQAVQAEGTPCRARLRSKSISPFRKHWRIHTAIFPTGSGRRSKAGSWTSRTGGCAKWTRNGIEMMLLSLNAPAVQAISDTARASRDRAQIQRLSRRTGRQAAGQVSGPGRAGDAGPGRRGARARALRQRARLSRCAGQRLLASRRRRDHGSITTCRNTGRSGRRSNGSTCRSICIRAIRCRATPRSMKAIPGCWARSGRSARKPRCMRCG